MKAYALRLAAALGLWTLVMALGTGAASARTYNDGLTVWASDKTLSAGDEVRGDVTVAFGSLTCEDGAVIDGNVRTYFGDFEEYSGCNVSGRVVHAFSDGDQLSALPFVPDVSVPDALAENRKIFEKLAWDAVVVLIFLLFPLRVRVALERVESHPGLSALAGAVALVAVVPIAVMLLLSIIGIPLIVIEFAAFLAAIWIGHAAVALLVGRRLYELIRPHATPSPLGALLVGLIVVSAAQTLPVVGWAVSALVWIVGLGATVLAFMKETAFRSTTGTLPAKPA
jgi:hypothetical protein